MIMARVVLPEPGRPGQQHVVGRRPAALGRLEHEAELVAHPRLARELAEPSRPQGRLDGRASSESPPASTMRAVASSELSS